jgi:hypothetical protein
MSDDTSDAPLWAYLVLFLSATVLIACKDLDALTRF